MSCVMICNSTEHRLVGRVVVYAWHGLMRLIARSVPYNLVADVHNPWGLSVLYEIPIHVHHKRDPELVSVIQEAFTYCKVVTKSMLVVNVKHLQDVFNAFVPHVKDIILTWRSVQDVNVPEVWLDKGSGLINVFHARSMCFNYV